MCIISIMSIMKNVLKIQKYISYAFKIIMSNYFKILFWLRKNDKKFRVVRILT